MLWLLHPDASVRKSLTQSLENAWPGLVCTAYAPNTQPTDIPAHAVVLTTEILPNLPNERTILLDRPRRQATLMREIAQAVRHSHMPAILHLATDKITCCLNTRTRAWTSDNGIATELTEKEIAVLMYLHHRQAAATREDLLRDVWLYATDADTHTVETHMYRLRQKIEKDPSEPTILITQEDGYILAAVAKA